MKGIKLLAAVGITATAVLLAGCGRADPGAGSPANPSTSPVTQSTRPPTSEAATTRATTPVTTRARPHHIPSHHVPAPHRAPVLANGRHCAFMTGLDARSRKLTFDVVQWLTGDEADAAFHRDHPEAPDVGVPNGFYIVNANPRLRTLTVGPGAVVSVLVPMYGSTQQTIRFSALPGHLAANDLDPDDGKLWHNPFWLTVHNDRITSIVEQYTP